MGGHGVGRLQDADKGILAVGCPDALSHLMALEGKIPCSHVPADGHEF